MRSLIFVILLAKFLVVVESRPQVLGVDEIYFGVQAKEAYNETFDWCARLGGIPAKIPNVYGNAYVLALSKDLGPSVYIGVERKETGGDWTYADGTPLVYQNWAQDEPKEANLCTVMNTQTGKWVSADCSTARMFLCSYEVERSYKQ